MSDLTVSTLAASTLTVSTPLFADAVESLTTRWDIAASDAAAAMIDAAEGNRLTIADIAAYVYAAHDQRRLIEAMPTRRPSASLREVTAAAS